MDSVIVVLNMVKGYPIFWILVLGWLAIFLFFIVLSIVTATVPDRRLYAAGNDGAKKAKLRAIKNSFRSSPEKWLLYEEEIFYVKNPDELSPEDRDAYEIAQARCVNGGLEARQVGTRVRLRRGEVKAYLRFFYGLHKERPQRAPRVRRAPEAKLAEAEE